LPGYGGLILFDAYVPIIMVLGLTMLGLLSAARAARLLP